MSEESQAFLTGLRSVDKFKVIVEDEGLAKGIDKIAVFPEAYKQYISDLDIGQFGVICRSILGMSERSQAFLAELESVDEFRIIVEDEGLVRDIDKIAIFPVAYISGLDGGQFGGICRSILGMEEESRDFLKGLDSVAKFKVIMEDEGLVRDIDKIAVFPVAYISDLDIGQFGGICRSILGMKEESRAFLKGLGSVAKFKIIVEDKSLVRDIDNIAAFPVEYIRVLDDEEFAQTCVRIVEMSEGVRGFLIELKCADKFKAIVEKGQLIRDIDKIAVFSLGYIKGLSEDQFAQTCVRIVEMSEGVRGFLIGLRCVDKFKVIVEKGQLVRNIEKIVGLPAGYQRYICNLKVEQFKIICVRVVEMSEGVRDFLIRLGCVDRFKVIVEDIRLVRIINQIARLPADYQRYIGSLEEEPFNLICARIEKLLEEAIDFLIRLGCVDRFKVIVEDIRLIRIINKIARLPADYQRYIGNLEEEPFNLICARIEGLLERAIDFLAELNSLDKFKIVIVEIKSHQLLEILEFPEEYKRMYILDLPANSLGETLRRILLVPEKRLKQLTVPEFKVISDNSSDDQLAEDVRNYILIREASIAYIQPDKLKHTLFIWSLTVPEVNGISDVYGMKQLNLALRLESELPSHEVIIDWMDEIMEYVFNSKRADIERQLSLPHHIFTLPIFPFRDPEIVSDEDNDYSSFTKLLDVRRSVVARGGDIKSFAEDNVVKEMLAFEGTCRQEHGDVCILSFRIMFIDKKLVPLVYDLANNSGQPNQDKFQKLMDKTLSAMVKPFYKRTRIILQTFFVQSCNEFDLDVVLNALDELNDRLNRWVNLFRNSENYSQFSKIIEDRFKELKEAICNQCTNKREIASNFFFCKWLAYKREYKILLTYKDSMILLPLSAFPYSSQGDLWFLKRVITELFTNEVQYLKAECDKFRCQSDYAIRNMDEIFVLLRKLMEIKIYIMIPNELRSIDILIQLNRYTEDIIRTLNAQLIEFAKRKLPKNPKPLNLSTSNLPQSEQFKIMQLREFATAQVKKIDIVIGELKTEQKKGQQNYTKQQILQFLSINPEDMFQYMPRDKSYTDLFQREKLRIAAMDILPKYGELTIRILKEFNLFFHALPISPANRNTFTDHYKEFIVDVKKAAQ
jgi:hypothetical protein